MRSCKLGSSRVSLPKAHFTSCRRVEQSPLCIRNRRSPAVCCEAKSEPHPSLPRKAVARSLQQVEVHFNSSEVFATARPGDNLWQVAQDAGVTIPTGCFTGNCGICEVELRKFDEQGNEGAPVVVRSCCTVVPAGFQRVEVGDLQDEIWGLDGWDT